MTFIDTMPFDSLLYVTSYMYEVETDLSGHPKGGAEMSDKYTIDSSEIQRLFYLFSIHNLSNFKFIALFVDLNNMIRIKITENDYMAERKSIGKNLILIYFGPDGFIPVADNLVAIQKAYCPQICASIQSMQILLENMINGFIEEIENAVSVANEMIEARFVSSNTMIIPQNEKKMIMMHTTHDVIVKKLYSHYQKARESIITGFRSERNLYYERCLHRLLESYSICHEEIRLGFRETYGVEQKLLLDQMAMSNEEESLGQRELISKRTGINVRKIDAYIQNKRRTDKTIRKKTSQAGIRILADRRSSLNLPAKSDSGTSELWNTSLSVSSEKRQNKFAHAATNSRATTKATETQKAKVGAKPGDQGQYEAGFASVHVWNLIDSQDFHSCDVSNIHSEFQSFDNAFDFDCFST